MKHILPVLLLITCLTACSSKTQPAETQTPNAVDVAQSDKTPETTQSTTDEMPKDDAATAAKNDDAAPDAPDAAKPADPPVEFPKIDAKFDSDEKDENGNVIIAHYFANSDEDSDIVEKIESQLREAGFTPIPNGYHTNYEKVQGDQFAVISITEGEGEVWVTMSRTRDMQKRYIKADPRIPYPLDQGFAAEYAKQTDGNNGELTYTFYNRQSEFLSDYEKRLQDAGFKKESDDKLLYTKKLSDNTILSVMINMLNERGTDMDITMSAVLSK